MTWRSRSRRHLHLGLNQAAELKPLKSKFRVGFDFRVVPWIPKRRVKTSFFDFLSSKICQDWPPNCLLRRRKEQEKEKNRKVASPSKTSFPASLMNWEPRINKNEPLDNLSALASSLFSSGSLLMRRSCSSKSFGARAFNSVILLDVLIGLNNWIHSNIYFSRFFYAKFRQAVKRYHHRNIDNNGRNKKYI
jgi:hypothetical protein